MTATHTTEELREEILAGRTSLGIEFGSTRIKACLIANVDPNNVIAVGGYAWENSFVDRLWTYSLDEVTAGLQGAYAGLVDDVVKRYGVRPDRYSAIGISGMMHGYLAFDDNDELLVPFRTWRNTNTSVAAAELSKAFRGQYSIALVNFPSPSGRRGRGAARSRRPFRHHSRRLRALEADGQEGAGRG